MSELITKREPPFFYITFKRPAKKNAFNAAIYQELPKIVNQVNKDEEIVFTVFTGNGDFFSAGTELNSNKLEDQGSGSFKPPYGPLAEEMIEHKKILIALLNGPAIGIAATLLSLFDLVLASDRAYLLAPFAKLGLLAEGTSSTNWPQLIGRIKTAKHLLFAEPISAKEAHQSGLVSHVYPHDKFEEECQKYLKYLTTLAPGSLLITKELMVKNLRPNWRNTHADEMNALILRSKDKEMFDFIAKSIQQRKSKL
ncbi:unnamed protein product [Bursaphelenchus okinawaensis]|uniref:Uncharacterized protein n=1 Tax=Bursaphelenchus okinawaensis TaxID=465554 RepID=A0A811JRP8_9BILA|nr:unnamed protein product [Bursaphelenchus okinawaensis]CAG9079381.1 unnamed protein product [Bursaphelenchus okinawaensis]